MKSPTNKDFEMAELNNQKKVSDIRSTLNNPSQVNAEHLLVIRSGTLTSITLENPLYKSINIQ